MTRTLKEEWFFEIISPTLPEALEMINEYLKNKGKEFSEKELASKMNISLDQMRGYIEDEATMPPDFPKLLLHAYSMHITCLRNVITKISEPLPAPPDDV